ncbi:ABC transporter substrate-binding protein [Arthrobacter citreus]|jgi:ribose transport system substrate-binding protein|uniref:ABC transporter substrate-binding protein n=1 Tax=Arthrobacter citreus TaxID=1670 RepID=A0ABZ2ZUS4_9MICC
MRITKTLIRCAAASSAAALLLSACTTGDEAATQSGEPREIETIGLMVQDLSNPFFSAMQTGLEAKAEEIGATVNTQDGRQDLAAQNDQIDAFIQQQVDVILLNAVDSDGIASAVSRAKAAGIIVVAVDVGAEGADATVTTDNVAAGSQACQYLVDALGGTGNILIVDGTPITSVQDRVAGCEEVLADNPGIKVVGKQAGKNDRATSLTLTTDMLTANPVVDGIFAINDPTALGSALAAQQSGRAGIQIVGVDGSPEAVAELQKAESPFVATPAQDPAGIVVRGLEIAQEIASGESPEETEVLMPTELITRENLSTYKGWT